MCIRDRCYVYVYVYVCVCVCVFKDDKVKKIMKTSYYFKIRVKSPIYCNQFVPFIIIQLKNFSVSLTPLLSFVRAVFNLIALRRGCHVFCSVENFQQLISCLLDFLRILVICSLRLTSSIVFGILKAIHHRCLLYTSRCV